MNNCSDNEREKVSKNIKKVFKEKFAMIKLENVTHTDQNDVAFERDLAETWRKK